jgi:hypothetical protein
VATGKSGLTSNEEATRHRPTVLVKDPCAPCPYQKRPICPVCAEPLERWGNEYFCAAAMKVHTTHWEK